MRVKHVLGVAKTQQTPFEFAIQLRLDKPACSASTFGGDPAYGLVCRKGLPTAICASIAHVWLSILNRFYFQSAFFILQAHVFLP